MAPMARLPTAGCVYLDGRFVRPDQAQVSLFDAGFLYGDGIYETLRTFGGQPFRLQAHLERLRSSARVLGMQAPAENLGELVLQTLAQAALPEAYVRITLTRGAGAAGLAHPGGDRPTLVIAALPLFGWPQALYEDGAKVALLWRRAKGELPAPTVKSTSLQRAIAGRAHARSQGADEGLFLDPEGFVAEGTVTNVFAVIGKTLHTPPPEVCLAGVTRAEVLDLAAGCGLVPLQAPLTPEALVDADEVFLTSTLAGLVPVTAVDGAMVGEGAPGFFWKNLQQAYRRRTGEEQAPE
jgi:branched-chain amino acid aminotransferase